MSIHESEDDLELPGVDSPPPLSDLLLRPFRNVIGTPQPIFLGRVTRSRSSAIPPLRNPNKDFLDAEELALQNAEAASTPPLANLGAVRDTSISDLSEAQDAEIRFSFADMARLLEIVSAKSSSLHRWSPNFQKHLEISQRQGFLLLLLSLYYCFLNLGIWKLLPCKQNSLLP